ETAGGAVGRDEEAGGDRAGDRRAAQVSPVRRADIGARSRQRRRDRRADRATAGRAGGNERGGVARRAGLVPRGGPGGAPVASEDPRRRPAGPDPRVQGSRRAAVPGARSRDDADPGRISGRSGGGGAWT